MRKTLLLFPTMALALLLAAGTAWAALPAPTVVSTGTDPSTTPPLTGVVTTANITATFSEAMSTKSFQILNHSTTTPPSTNSSNTFYLLKGQFTGSATKNPPRFCSTGTPPAPCPDPLPLIPATVSYTAGTLTATLNPRDALLPNTTYTVVVEGANDGDFVAVKDTGGTPMASDYIFHFTTAGGGPGGF
jgi:Bacterial Ig-like domain